MDETVNIEEAARAMGKKGGAVRSEKKLASAKRNIQKAAGGKKGKKYPGIYDLERRAAKTTKASPMANSDIHSMASILGHKGGSVKSEKKAISSRLNARGGIDGKGKRAGRPQIYQYTTQARALLGVRTRYSCLIPDEVAANPKKFLGKTFPAFYKGADGKDRRAKARIVSIDKEKNEIILTHFFTRPSP